MSGDLEEDNLELLKYLSSFDKEQAILNGDARWVIIWRHPSIHLMSEISESSQRLIELAHSDEAILLTVDNDANVDSQVEKLVGKAYLTREALDIYKIESKLVDGLARLTRNDP